MRQQIRINKYIAESGIASRRKADELIKAGKVKINGQTILEPGVIISERATVEVNGKKISAKEKKYIIFYKPAGYITTCDDPLERRTIYDILPRELHNLKPAGRLDKDSSGLIILTNDGELIQNLTHPKVKVPKEYKVLVDGKITKQELLVLKNGIEIEEGKIAYADAVMIDYKDSVTSLEVVLHQGYNRQIRRMMDSIGHPVLALKRVAHANMVLAGLDKGRYRYLKNKEVDALYNFIKKLNKKSVN